MKTIGVIGLGSIGMRHAKNLITMGHQVIGVDQDKSRLEEFTKAGGRTSGILEITDGTDAVVIASPTTKHAEHLNLAITAGKHTLIEKPIADSPVISNYLGDAHRRNLTIFVGYNCRFRSCVKQAKQWLSEGKIGNPIWASVTLAQYSEKEPYLRDGVILNWSHEIDLALYLLGPARVITATTRNWRTVAVGMPTELKDEMADIVLGHSGGVRSTIHLDYVTRPEIRATTIIGDKGQIAIDLVNNTACFVDLEGKREDLQLQQDWSQTYIDEMVAFLARIEGKTTLGATGEEGLAVLEVCLEARRLAGVT